MEGLSTEVFYSLGIIYIFKSYFIFLVGIKLISQ